MADVTMLALVAVCFLAAQAYARVCNRLLPAPAAHGHIEDETDDGRGVA